MIPSFFQITGSGFLELGMGCHRLNALSLEHLPNLKDDHLQVHLLKFHFHTMFVSVRSCEVTK